MVANLKSFPEKLTILKMKKGFLQANEAYKGVFIDSDRSKHDRDIRTKLLSAASKARLTHTDVRIREGELLIDGKPWKWDDK